MRVKLATQVFSNSVKAALQTAVETGQLPEEALQTATFIGELNDIFDCLNSRQLFDSNPLKCAISTKTDQGKNILVKLSSSKTWIDSWRKKMPSKPKTTGTELEKKKNKKFQPIPPCFHGFKLSIASVIELWKCLQREEGDVFLLTNRLTQDVVEHEFSISRQRGGFDRNPSAMKFRQNLRQRMQISLMKPSSNSNCELSEDIPLITNITDFDETDDLVELCDTSDDDISEKEDGGDEQCSIAIEGETSDECSDKEDGNFTSLETTLQTINLETCSVQ